MAFEAALKMDVSGFTSGINKAASGVAELTTTIQGLAIVGGIGVGLSKMADMVGQSFAQMYSAMEAGGAMVDLSEQTGLAIDKLMVLQTAFKQAGMAAEDVQPVINKMQKAIQGAATSSGPASSAFSKLGLSAQTLSGLRADEQLQLIGDAIVKIQNPTERAAAAMEIFGKSGGRALALFAAGGLDDAAEAVGRQAKLMRENAGVFDRVTDVLGTAATKLQGLYVGMASNIAPLLLNAVTAFNKIDLSGIGQQIGMVVAILREAFSEGVLGKITYEALKYAFIASVNLLSGVLSGTLAFIIQRTIANFKLITNPDFWGGMLTTLVGIAQTFISKMADGVAFILDQWAKLPGIGQKAAEAAQGVRSYAAQVGARGGENTGAGMAELRPILKEELDGIVTAIQEAYATAPKMEQSKALSDIIGKLSANASTRLQAFRDLFPEKKPEAPPGELQALAKPGNEFASSLAKIGGGQFGPTLGQDESINIQKMQLEQQKRQSDRIAETNVLLKIIANKSATGSAVYN